MDSAKSHALKIRLFLVAAAALLIVVACWILWQPSQNSAQAIPGTAGSSTSRPPSPAEAAFSPGLPGKTQPLRQDSFRTNADETAQRQMAAWLGDPKVSEEEAARRLWDMACDTSQSESVRSDGLVNALNLASDKQMQAEFLDSLGKPGVWTGALAQQLLDDLYNRSERLKVSAAAALLPQATGEFQENLRDLLQFQLDAEGADDATLIRLAAEKISAPAPPEEGG